jgi:putative aldouronate transport system permease protein
MERVVATRTMPLVTRQARRRRERLRRLLPLYIMLLPAVIGLALFTYYPMYGLIIAFQRFDPLLGFSRSPFVGLENFRRIFSTPDTYAIIRNTLVIAAGKLALGLLASLAFALLLNEVRVAWFKRTIQSLSYVLHFLSWVILGGILLRILSLDGIVNQGIRAIGLPPIFFLGDTRVFPFTMIVTDVWKEFGFGAIIYLAAITSIDPTLYEAAAVDGANRWQRMRHITLPSIAPVVALVACLSLGSILNAGFEQILVLYNPVVFATGDIIDTYVYRAGLLNYEFSLATAFGLLKSVVGLILIALSYWLAERFANYRIF